MLFFKIPKVEGTVNSMKQRLESFVELMTFHCPIQLKKFPRISSLYSFSKLLDLSKQITTFSYILQNFSFFIPILLISYHPIRFSSIKESSACCPSNIVVTVVASLPPAVAGIHVVTVVPITTGVPTV